MLRALRTAILALGALCIGLMGVLLVARFAPDSRVGQIFAPPLTTGQPAALAQLSIGGPFVLQDQTGHPVTQASYPGRWLLIYFGYTSCPDICPTTLQSIAGALAELGPQAARLTPLFITIDPARDSPEVLARYTALFDRRLIGLTGTQPQITAAERSFRVYAARAGASGATSYTMDHTSFVYLLDPTGHLTALFDRTITATDLAARIRKAMT